MPLEAQFYLKFGIVIHLIIGFFMITQPHLISKFAGDEDTALFDFQKEISESLESQVAEMALD